MNGLSEVCQYPHCAKPAVFCCSKCLKRTYCSDRCQVLDWENHKTCCVENEKKAEIIESIKQLSSRHGSVFAAQKQSRKNTHTNIEKDNDNSKKPKVTVEYNGSLLPYSLEVVNNSIIKFFVACRSDDDFGKYFSRKKSDLYRTSSVSETSNLLQTVLLHISKIQKFEKFEEREVSESLKEMMSLLIELAESFNQPDLARELQNETLYSSANDYKSTSEDRLFCTHCGDKANLKEHPKLNYVHFCKECLDNYMSNEWVQEDNHDNECYCCGDGGNVVLCDKCNHSICSNCILLHMGVDEWEKVLHEDEWACFVCKRDKDGNAIFAKES